MKSYQKKKLEKLIVENQLSLIKDVKALQLVLLFISGDKSTCLIWYGNYLYDKWYLNRQRARDRSKLPWSADSAIERPKGKSKLPLKSKQRLPSTPLSHRLDLCFEMKLGLHLAWHFDSATIPKRVWVIVGIWVLFYRQMATIDSTLGS